MPDPSSPEKTTKLQKIRNGLVRLASLCNNPISAFGLFLVAFALLLMVTFALFSLMVQPSTPYFMVVGVLVLPGVFVLGLAIAPVGIIWTVRRERRLGKGTPVPMRIDLNDARTRHAVGAFLAVTFFIVLPVLAVSGYEGYHYTETTGFCGKVCHSVMEPQATVHASSAHARVRCAECHIGGGASWFVRSKLSGTRQVFAVMFDSYSRPIPPAITELRPARETCEECHWPSRFFGWQYREVDHFVGDEHNTPRTVRMMLKTGGAAEEVGGEGGIHSHMMTSGTMSFVALDDRLQEIPWVRYARDDGRVTIYRSDGKPAGDPPPEGITRTMDCMDCHNRGAHHFRSPQRAVNVALAGGQLDQTLPYIKREAVAALVEPYPDVETALASIETRLLDFYQQRWVTVWAERPDAVREAIKQVQALYRANFFPAMKVNWRTYPENVGHMYAPGCFRCHDGLHVDDRGNAISADCTDCHVFLTQIDGRADDFQVGQFEHPFDLVVHQNLRCSNCHSGGRHPRCDDCHSSTDWQSNRGRGQLRRAPTTTAPTDFSAVPKTER